MPKSGLILRCIYGTNNKDYNSNLRVVPSLFSLFNVGYNDDKLLKDLNYSFKTESRKTDNPQDTNECPEYIFWVRLFLLLLNADSNIKSLPNPGLWNNVKLITKIGPDTCSNWKKAYFNNAFGLAEDGNKKHNPLIALRILIFGSRKSIWNNAINNKALGNRLISAPLTEYIIKIYSNKGIHTLQECDKNGDAILTGFKDNWLLKDLNGCDRSIPCEKRDDELAFISVINEFTKEFVNTIRSCLGQPYEEQIHDTVTSINDDSNGLLAEPISTRIGQDYYDGLSLFQKNNRFKYNSGKIDFQGRTAEIDTINKMCESTEPFLWLSITGKGGMGKTRLAYQMCIELNDKEWLTFEPTHSKPNAEAIINSIESSNKKVFICFDYVKFNIDEIKEIMLHLLEIAAKQKTIRVVLIERDPEDIEITDDYLLAGYMYSDIPEEIASDGKKSISLGKLSREDYFAIIKQYYKEYTGLDAKNYDNLTRVYDKFEELDNNINRPLFALFITDAMISGEDLTSWDEKDALMYFVKREQSRIRSVIDKFFSHDRIKSKNYYSAVRFILELATYLDGIELAEHNDLIYYRFGIDVNDKGLLEILDRIGLISDNNTVTATKPDLIGEFSTIEFFDSLSVEETQSFIDYIIKKDFDSFLNHTKKMYDDYKSIISGRDWARCIKTIHFPTNTNFVRHHLFCNNDFIEEVILHDQVYEIGAAAFMNAKNLRIMELPSSIKLIGKMAFNGCIALTKIAHANQRSHTSSLIKIEKMAFKGCSALTSFYLPSSLMHIEEAAFSGCKQLNKVVIPPKIKAIPNECFMGCESLSSCNLPKKLVSIGDSAFNRTNISEITLPTSLKDLGRDCFLDCSMLETVSIAESSSIIIGISCFRNCTMLSEINFENISKIGSFAFCGCEKIVSITLIHPKTEISEGAFMNCASLQRVDLAETDIDILPANIFRNCNSLKTVKLPKTVKTIEKRAFMNCNSLNTIEIPHRTEEIEEEAFSGCVNLEEIEFASSIRRIRPKVFQNCRKIRTSCFTNLNVQKMYEICGLSLKAVDEATVSLLTLDSNATSIDIPKTVTMINDNAFKGLKKLDSVKIHGSVFLIGKNAFRGCTKLRTVDLGKSHIRKIGKDAFNGCTALSSINGILKMSVIEDGTFLGCKSLKEIKINNQISRIGSSAFLHCEINSIYQYDKNLFESIHELYYRKCLKNGIPLELGTNKNNTKIIVDGFSFKKLEDNEIVFLNSYKKSSEVVIPDSCYKISGNPFIDNTSLEEVVVPNGVEELPNGIFSGCVNLKIVRLGSNISKIPAYAFKGCRSLISIRFGNLSENTIPSNVSLGPFAFWGCHSITQLVLPDDMISIPYKAFGYCQSLKIKELPSSLDAIGNYAFMGCISIEELVFPNNLKTIGIGCFSNCTELITVDLSKTMIKGIQNDSFLDCGNLKRVELPIKLKSIGPGAFKNCYMLSEIDLYNTSLTYIGVGAFQECFSIPKVSLPNGITEISGHCFKGCKAINFVNLPKQLESIGDSAFYKCISLSEIDLPNSLKTLGTAVFSYSGLTHIELPNTLSTLSNNLFENCSKLESVSIPLHITSIPNDCFRGCGFSSISLPDKLQKISVGAFRSCLNLETIKIPDTVTEIDNSAFRSCVRLREFECPEGVRIIKKAVFEHCLSLERVKLGRIDTVKRCAFMNCRSLMAIDLSLIKRGISYSSFQNCVSLNSIKFSNTLSYIYDAAFMGCNSIEQIEIPNSIKIISASAFRDIKNLKMVILPNVEELEICKSAFRDCINLKDVVVNSKKIYIRPKAFKGCNSLYDITLPEETTICVNSFDGCPNERRIMAIDNIQICEATD